MTHDDDRLRRLLDDAVAGIEPGEGLGAIRKRTERPARRYQPWLAGAVGVAAATAAILGGVALLGGDDADEPTPVASDPPTVASGDPSGWGQIPPAIPGTHAVPAYYLGDGPTEPVLYREFRRSDEPVEGLEQSIAALMEEPADPDYRTAWRRGDLISADYDGQEITVAVSADVAGERPREITAREAELAVQQVVYTLQATVGGRPPVAFYVAESDDESRQATQVLGVRADAPIDNAPVLRTLSLVNVTTPESAQKVSGRLTANGVANSFEATVPWQILDADGAVALSGFSTASGWTSPMLYPWESEVDLADLAPGEYTFVASTDDPSGGSEGPGPHQDTKTFTIE